MALIDIKNLSFSYPDSGEKALDNISLSIERGEFVTLMGATGSGKSTLLRMLKPQLSLNGTLGGSVSYDGADIGSLSPRDSAGRIGYVAQKPEEQIVTDKVWHELAFTLESLGAAREFIARRIAEVSAFFGTDGLYDRDTASLSGGQKQLINLAAVMTADPELLILDEPTAQLDPISASRFIDALRRLNRETGLTVVICEHRAEELLPVCDRVVVLERGRIIYDGAPRDFAEQISADSPYAAYLTAASRIFISTGGRGEVPLSIREGQRYVRGCSNKIKTYMGEKTSHNGNAALEMKNIFFRYDKDGADVLSDYSMTVYEGEVFAVLGSNGVGKSTAAAVAAGLKKPYSGSVRLFSKRLGDYKNGSLYRGNISLLPQDPESVFIHETVKEELKGCEPVQKSLPFDFTPLYGRHPYDISGGERQLLALCKALSTDPRLIILDEPSKGLDGSSKELLIRVIGDLRQKGVTVLLISHDVEFAAMCADRCALFSQGRLCAVESTQSFMTGNRFYTTAASRITRPHFENAYTAERAVSLIRQNGGAV